MSELRIQMKREWKINQQGHTIQFNSIQYFISDTNVVITIVKRARLTRRKR